MARTKPYSRPLRPPRASPPNKRIPLRRPNNNAVFTAFISPVSHEQKRRGGSKPAPRGKPYVRSTQLHLNLARLRDLLFRQHQSQGAVLVVGFHRLRIHGLGESEHPLESPVGPLDAMPAATILLGLELAFATDGQVSVLHPHIDVFQFDVGNI